MDPPLVIGLLNAAPLPWLDFLSRTLQLESKLWVSPGSILVVCSKKTLNFGLTVDPAVSQYLTWKTFM